MSPHIVRESYQNLVVKISFFNLHKRRKGDAKLK